MCAQVLQETLPSSRRSGGAKYSRVLAADEAAEQGLGLRGAARERGLAVDCEPAAEGHRADRLSIAVQAEQPPGGSCRRGSCCMGVERFWRAGLAQ